jgi:hypothetical protein
MFAIVVYDRHSDVTAVPGIICVIVVYDRHSDVTAVPGIICVSIIFLFLFVCAI